MQPPPPLPSPPLYPPASAEFIVRTRKIWNEEKKLEIEINLGSFFSVCRRFEFRSVAFSCRIRHEVKWKYGESHN